MANAVLVIDMLRGFLEEGHPLYCGDKARHIIPSVQALLKQELAKAKHSQKTLKKKGGKKS